MKPKNVLVISAGATFSRSFLFFVDEQKVELVSTNEVLTTPQTNLIMESLKSRHKGQFDELIVSRDKGDPFEAALQQFSGTGEFQAIDIGSSETLLGVASFGKARVTRLSWGVGRRSRKVLFSPEQTTNLASWLTDLWKLTEIENLVAHQSIYPGILPLTKGHWELNFALVREILLEAVKRKKLKEEEADRSPTLRAQGEREERAKIRGFSNQYPAVSDSPVAGRKQVSSDVLPTFILSGAVLGKSPDLGQVLLSFLDGTNVEGFFQVFLDRNLLFGALGALASAGFALPLAQAQDDSGYFPNLPLQSTVYPFGAGGLALIRKLGFENLGTVIVLSHQQPEGKIVAELILDLGLDEQLEVQVKSGEIMRVPFAEEDSGDVILSLKSGVRILSLSESKIRIEGGSLGFIIDGRGRPLTRPSVNEEGRKRLKKWIEVLAWR